MQTASCGDLIQQSAEDKTLAWRGSVEQKWLFERRMRYYLKSVNDEMTGHGLRRARFGPYEVDLHTHELWKFGTRLKLVGQPFAILTMLLRRPGELVTREELRGRLWPSDTFVDFNHGLNAAVNKLRDALSDSADQPRYIETLPRRGYRFAATVEWVDRKQPDVVSVPAAVLPPEREIFSAPSKRTPRAAGALRIAAFIVALSVGVLLFRTATKNINLRVVDQASAERKTKPLTEVPNTEQPAFSPDGNYVAFVRGDAGAGGIYVTKIGSDQLQRLTRNDDDCCPVWAADGESIAFTRSAGQSAALYTIAVDGKTGERRLDLQGVAPEHGYLDWSPDGKSIAFAGDAGIYSLDRETGKVRRLTEPPAHAEDRAPAFSPDGKKILFLRDHEAGRPSEMWAMSLNDGRENRLLTESGRVVGAPRWSYDGRSVIYAASRNGHPMLWRSPVDGSDAATQISEAGPVAWDPAISRRGYRLAYERPVRSVGIWQMDLSKEGDKRPQVLIASTSDSDQGPGAQFSPDGTKLAFMSDRSGTMEIWVSNRDGSNAFQLSAVGNAGTPRWSPDGQAIVFDAATPNGVTIFKISLQGGAPENLLPDSFWGLCPSWSRDGKWVYFASEHPRERQVWKVAANGGGTPVQVTQHGGHAAHESLDGKTLYYAKSYEEEPEVWEMPPGGGLETLVPGVHAGTWASWQVVEGGILFVGPAIGHKAVLSFFDFNKKTAGTIAVLPRDPFWLGATADGKTAVMDQPGEQQTKAMMIENFK